MNEKELLVFSLCDGELDIDSGSSDLDELLLLCESEFTKSSMSRRSTSSELGSNSSSLSFVEMLDDDMEDETEMLSKSLSRISLSTNSSELV